MPLKDTNTRSVTKAVSWRLIGTLDTIFLSFLIIGNPLTAFSIGFTELVTKSVLYYFHERVWNAISWGRGSDEPSHLRSITKSISWRAVGTLDTIVLAYIISGDIVAGLSIGASELITKIVLYYLHERMWSRIKWGREMILETEKS